jgi:hypothetical protein
MHRLAQHRDAALAIARINNLISTKDGSSIAGSTVLFSVTASF